MGLQSIAMEPDTLATLVDLSRSCLRKEEVFAKIDVLFVLST